VENKGKKRGMKAKINAGISLLFSKNTKGAAKLKSPFDEQIDINSTYALISTY